MKILTPAHLMIRPKMGIISLVVLLGPAVAAAASMAYRMDFTVNYPSAFAVPAATFNYDAATGAFSNFTISWVLDQSTFSHDFTFRANNPAESVVPSCSPGLMNGHDTFACLTAPPGPGGDYWYSNPDMYTASSGLVYDDLAMYFNFGPNSNGVPYLTLDTGNLSAICDSNLGCVPEGFYVAPGGQFTVQQTGVSSTPEPATVGLTLIAFVLLVAKGKRIGDGLRWLPHSHPAHRDLIIQRPQTPRLVWLPVTTD